MTPNSDPLADAETVTAVINRVIFTNPDNGWAILHVTVDDFDGDALGAMLAPHVGDTVKLHGTWVHHPTHGEQFHFDAYERQLPSTAAEAEAYLSSGRIRGIGPVTARAIVAYFNDDTLHVLDTAIERLAEVPGIGAKKLAVITEGWKNAAQQRAIEMALLSVGAPTHHAGAIWDVFGSDGATIITTRPYDLTQVRGVGFPTCDAIAKQLGWDARDPRRLSAALGYTLEEASKNGHCFLPRPKLALTTANLIGVSPATCTEAIALAIEEERLVEDEHGCYSPRLHFIETDLVDQIVRLHEADLPMPTADQQQKVDKLLAKKELTDQQQDAVRAVLGQAVTILTGGPGVGKSHTIATVVEAAKVCGWTKLLCAPTGRAARRMSELADGHPAATVHRAIGYGIDDEEDEEKDSYLPADLVICDEASMLDVSLARNLVGAIRTGARVLFVGDTDQLPSVGPGNVLGDLIASGKATTVALTKIFRQAEKSGIVQVAHAVNAGKSPQYLGWDDLHLWATDDKDPNAADTAAVYVEAMVCDRIPSKFDIDPADIQVITPKRAGSCGVHELNRRLQARINPGTGREYVSTIAGETTIFRPGDRAMIIKNNYELGKQGVFNGTPVKVIAVDPDAEDEDDAAVTVLTDEGEEIAYPPKLVRQLTLAYAITIHKSQGSQYKCVVIPVTKQAWTMLVRNLVYTAITRAQERVVLIGSRQALARAVKTKDAAQRFTGLGARLRAVRDRLV